MSLPKFEHVILTRYNLGVYDWEDPEGWMEHRFQLFKKTRESLTEQQEIYKWVLCMDPRTPTRWLNRIFWDSRMHVFWDHPSNYRTEGWTITTRFDNDDILLPGAIKAIQGAFEPREMVLDVKYWQLAQMKLYTSERETPNSPFLSLIENGAKRTCYARPHSKMNREYPAKFVDLHHHALMVIHDMNLGNKVVGKQVHMQDISPEKAVQIKKYM